MVPALPVLSASRWTAAAVRVLAGSIPATLAALFAVIILTVGIFLGERRQRYALDAASRAIDLAKAMLGPVSLNAVRESSQETPCGASPTPRATAVNE